MADETLNKQRLIVYVPPLGGRTDNWDALRRRFEQDSDGESIEFRTWPADRNERVHTWSQGDLGTYSQRLAVAINQSFEAAKERGSPYQSVVLVGQSIGGLAVRAAWLHGFENGQPWAEKTERIVLLAGLSRGFVTRWEPGRSRWRALTMKLLIGTFRVLPGHFTWEDALAGSSFVTNLRLQWIRQGSDGATPPVVQILGDSDSVVHPDDATDGTQFGIGRNVPIAGANHASITDLSNDADGERYVILRKWVIGALPSGPDGNDEVKLRGTEDNLVMIVHGIRAGAHGWVQKLRDLLHEPDNQWYAVTPTYNFFSALQFAFPITRNRKARWFADQFSRIRADLPGATLHFAGHSNGTYVLGRCLQEIPAMKFERVYLAGSVLPVDYAWVPKMGSQVTTIRNDRGQRDLVVGLLAKGLRGLGMRDIGSAGFDGFGDLFVAPTGVIQGGLFPGGHGAPFDPTDNGALENIAAFLKDGNVTLPERANLEPWGMGGRLSNASGVLVPIGLSILVVLLIAPFLWPGWTTYILGGVGVIALVASAFV